MRVYRRISCIAQEEGDAIFFGMLPRITSQELTSKKYQARSLGKSQDLPQKNFREIKDCNKEEFNQKTKTSREKPTPRNSTIVD